jgi:hypothetical protein
MCADGGHRLLDWHYGMHTRSCLAGPQGGRYGPKSLLVQHAITLGSRALTLRHLRTSGSSRDRARRIDAGTRFRMLPRGPAAGFTVR